MDNDELLYAVCRLCGHTVTAFDPAVLEEYMDKHMETPCVESDSSLSALAGHVSARRVAMAPWN